MQPPVIGALDTTNLAHGANLAGVPGATVRPVDRHFLPLHTLVEKATNSLQRFLDAYLRRRGAANPADPAPLAPEVRIASEAKALTPPAPVPPPGWKPAQAGPSGAGDGHTRHSGSDRPPIPPRPVEPPVWLRQMSPSKLAKMRDQWSENCSADGETDWLQPPLLDGDTAVTGLHAIARKKDGGRLDVLGNGASGVVIGLSSGQRQYVAAKISNAARPRMERQRLAHEFAGFSKYYEAHGGADPNLVNVYGMANITLKGTQKAALLMERIDGHEGRAFFMKLNMLRKRNSISQNEFTAVVQFIMRDLLGLSARFEAAGMLHCDFKPENFMMDRHTRRPRMLDLGDWSTPNEIKMAGTPGFAAPEIFSNLPLTARTDVFALGATLIDAVEMPFGIACRNNEGLAPPSVDPAIPPMWPKWKTGAQGKLERSGAGPQAGGYDSMYRDLVEKMLARKKISERRIAEPDKPLPVNWVYKLLPRSPEKRLKQQVHARILRRQRLTAEMQAGSISAREALAAPYLKTPALSADPAENRAGVDRVIDLVFDHLDYDRRQHDQGRSRRQLSSGPEPGAGANHAWHAGPSGH